MIKTIMRDPMFLAQKSENATEVDAQVVTDLLDTLRANLDHCVGMAANMIGVRKNIIGSGSRPVSVCHDQSGDHEKAASVPDRGRMSVTGRCETLHEIRRD